MTTYERELQRIEADLKYLPRQITETKLRGAKLKAAEKQVRKAQARVEFCRVACESLPKLWTAYRPTRTRRGDNYARPEVTNIHRAITNLKSKNDDLKRAREQYANRFTDRQNHRQELRGLPEKIACLKSLMEIADKRRKPKKEQSSKWVEVAPGYVVEKYRVAAYCRTLKTEPIKNVSGGFYVITHPKGFVKLSLKQLHPGGRVAS